MSDYSYPPTREPASLPIQVSSPQPTEDSFRILLPTNGHPATRPSIEYAIWLAVLLKKPVLLLGISERAGGRNELENLLVETEQRLEENGIQYHRQVDRGRATLVIARYAQAGHYLTVAGPFGRPVWRRIMQGRSFRRLMARVQSPVLYVPAARLPVQHILVCLGGLGYAAGVEQVSIYLAKAAGARLTLLHVVEPINLNYPTAQEIHKNWQDILHTNTPQGENLRKGIKNAQQAGVEVSFKVRHGSAVSQILEEARGGNYDLLGMGSPYSAQGLRHLYLPNVTAEVAETLGRPVLTVCQGHELFLPTGM